MNTKISTSDVAYHHRLEYWNDIICNVFVKLNSKPVEDGSFKGKIDHQQMDFVGFSSVQTSPVLVNRTKQHVAQATQDHFKFSFQLQGQCVLEQSGRTTHLIPGDWVFYDSTQPYSLYFPEEYRQLVLQIPRRKIRSFIPQVELLTAKKINGREGLGHLASNFVQTTKSQLDTLPIQSFPQISQTLIDLLAIGVNSTFSGMNNQAIPQSTLLLQIKSFIHNNLRDPDLSVTHIANELHLSKRYVHRLFEEETMTVNTYIRKLRLEKCKQDLIDPLKSHQTINYIIYSWGFNTPAHFSRIFKTQYGLSPNAYRKNHLSSITLD